MRFRTSSCSHLCRSAQFVVTFAPLCCQQGDRLAACIDPARAHLAPSLFGPDRTLVLLNKPWLWPHGLPSARHAIHRATVPAATDFAVSRASFLLPARRTVGRCCGTLPRPCPSARLRCICSAGLDFDRPCYAGAAARPPYPLWSRPRHPPRVSRRSSVRAPPTSPSPPFVTGTPFPPVPTLRQRCRRHPRPISDPPPVFSFRDDGRPTIWRRRLHQPPPWPRAGGGGPGRGCGWPARGGGCETGCGSV